jgi:hypothetical protein
VQAENRRRQPGSIEEIEEILSEPNDTPITPTSPEEIREIIGSLKVKKAPGPDDIPNTSLKLMADKVVVALTAIINASLRRCHLTSRWKRANVIFIPKPGKDSKFPQNYRSIRKSRRKSYSDPAGQNG